MARVELMPGIKSISGTVGNLTFKTRNGKTFVYEKPEPELPENPTRKEKARHKRAVMLNRCVALVQREIGDLQEATRQRKKIYERMASLYDKYQKSIKAPTKLMKKIMEEYCAKNQAVGGKDPMESRECIENDSKTARLAFGALGRGLTANRH